MRHHRLLVFYNVVDLLSTAMTMAILVASFIFGYAKGNSPIIIGLLSCLAFTLGSVVVLYRDVYDQFALRQRTFYVLLTIAKIANIVAFALAILGVSFAAYFIPNAINTVDVDIEVAMNGLLSIMIAILILIAARLFVQGRYIIELNRQGKHPICRSQAIHDYITPALYKMNRRPR